MTFMRSTKRYLSILLTALFMLTSMASLQAQAATNYFWFSAPNASTYYQTWPSVFIQPDGVIVQSLRQNRAGVMVNTVDAGKKFYDASRRFRDRAMKGILNSGRIVSDPRSRKRNSL